MSDIRIEVFHGDYHTDNARDRVIRYIVKKKHLQGYILPPLESDSIISQFIQCEENSHFTDTRKIWHFIISFAGKPDIETLMNTANRIGAVFACDYQVIYALDCEHSNRHLHFAVNPYSYCPNHAFLSDEIMKNYMDNIYSCLLSCFPFRTVTLQFMKKGEKDV